MTIFQMLGQSGLLTLLGMAVVFAFIIILIVCMNVLHGVVHALRLDKDEVKPVSKPAAKVSASFNIFIADFIKHWTCRKHICRCHSCSVKRLVRVTDCKFSNSYFSHFNFYLL